MAETINHYGAKSDLYVISEKLEDGSEYHYVADRTLEPLRCHEKKVHEAFSKLAGKHIKASGGLLSLLEYNPDQFPAQRLDVVEVQSPSHTSLQTLEGFATAAYANFSNIKDEFLKEKHSKMFSMIGLDIAEGRRYTAAFDHGRIFNMPLGAVAFSGALEAGAEAAHEPLPDYYRRITASKLLSRVNALGIPAPNILSLFDVLDMSIPPSKTVEDAGIDKDTRRKFNNSLRSVRGQLDITGMIRDDGRSGRLPVVVDFLSPSGTADVESGRSFGRNRRPPMIHLGPMAPGTADMLGETRVLPVAVNVNHAVPRVAIGRVMNPPRDMDDAQRVMHAVAGLGEEATKRQHVYHTTKESFERAIGWINRHHKN